MILKWVENKSKKHQKVCKPQADISFIKEYKQSHNKVALKILITPRRVNVLLGINRRRQRFSERRTVMAVDSCRRLINNEIEGFFEQKERVVNNRLLTEIIYGEKSYADIFGNDDLEKIYRQTENVIRHELFERFNSHIVWQLKKGRIADDLVSNSFNQLQKYQNTKMRTILITSCMETLSRKTVTDSIESFIENSLIGKFSSNIDISELILEKLDINSNSETMELMVQLSDRIKGALDSIKLGLFQDISDQIANIFYEAHDILIYSKIEMKINLLEKEIIREEIYETNLLEA
ncbi:hypothetical protein [Desulfosporosinus sp. OT]|uniref:hypothetical protein n=1 Tax=Desulfosporosinus sp. OT TaxID=913865 RepID=UPI0002239E23|nr:hypothetical protein [Desulfosporosinus sp. OT]EGW40068.1 hypothetical protein DOT_1783 [Desulfosporosinus sp. OT]